MWCKLHHFLNSVFILNIFLCILRCFNAPVLRLPAADRTFQRKKINYQLKTNLKPTTYQTCSLPMPRSQCNQPGLVSKLNGVSVLTVASCKSCNSWDRAEMVWCTKFNHIKCASTRTPTHTSFTISGVRGLIWSQMYEIRSVCTSARGSPS